MTRPRVDHPAPEVHPVTPDRLADLADLFGSNGTTRGCWCMWFRAPRPEVHAGWSGGNRVAFEAMAAVADPPPGVLAYRDGVPLGWCAIAPRSHYPAAIGPRTRILRGRDPAEDDRVWLVSCFFVRVGHRRTGLTRALLEDAVALAARYAATAVEGFPLAGPGSATGDRFVGTQSLFLACGFTVIARPTPARVVVRREVTARG
jgi:GNAT superfamily N-acetyltransferase